MGLVKGFCPKVRQEYDVAGWYCPYCNVQHDSTYKCATPTCKIAIYAGNMWGPPVDDFQKPATADPAGRGWLCSQCAPRAGSAPAAGAGARSPAAGSPRIQTPPVYMGIPGLQQAVNRSRAQSAATRQPVRVQAPPRVAAPRRRSPAYRTPRRSGGSFRSSATTAAGFFQTLFAGAVILAMSAALLAGAYFFGQWLGATFLAGLGPAWLAPSMAYVAPLWGLGFSALYVSPWLWQSLGGRYVSMGVYRARRRLSWLLWLLLILVAILVILAAFGENVGEAFRDQF